MSSPPPPLFELMEQRESARSVAVACSSQAFAAVDALHDLLAVVTGRVPHVPGCLFLGHPTRRMSQVCPACRLIGAAERFLDEAGQVPS